MSYQMKTHSFATSKKVLHFFLPWPFFYSALPPTPSLEPSWNFSWTVVMVSLWFFPPASCCSCSVSLKWLFSLPKSSSCFQYTHILVNVIQSHDVNHHLCVDEFQILPFPSTKVPLLSFLLFPSLSSFLLSSANFSLDSDLSSIFFSRAQCLHHIILGLRGTSLIGLQGPHLQDTGPFQ